MLRITMLGGFQVERDGRVLDGKSWPRRKTKSLLKLLALQPDHRMHKEQLAEVLWPQLTTAAACANLYRTLYYLRQTLEPSLSKPAASRLLTLKKDIVRLEIGLDVWLDLAVFEKLLGNNRLGSAAVSLEELEEAVRLYRGDLEQEESDEEWLVAYRDNYRHQFHQLLFELGTLYCQAGNYQAAIVTLQRLLEREVCHEAAHQLLMHAFALAGQTEAALGQYQLCVHALVQEANLRPTPQTVKLYQSILEGQLKPLLSHQDAAPVHLPPEQANSASIYSTLARNNPGDKAVIGRSLEIADLEGLLQKPAVRLLTITGPGGVGKTHLMLALLARLQPYFQHGIYLVELAALSKPDLLLETIASALKVGKDASQPLLDGLQSYLRPRQMLMVLDNFEGVVEGAAGLIDLLKAAPGLKILVTSRTVLGLYGEYEYPVAPLALPDVSASTTLEHLGQTPAVAFLLARVRLSQSDFRLTDSNAAAITAICRQLDGLPLALELAAFHFQHLSPAQLLNQLSQMLWQPSSPLPAVGMPLHHRTLRATLNWSYGLLSKVEQQFFAFLGVYVGGWTLEAAEEIYSCSPASPAPAVLERLTGLRNKSLIHLADGRFSMLEPVRQYALEKLSEATNRDRVYRRHADYFLDLAQRPDLGLGGTVQPAWLDMVESDYPNLRAALNWWSEAAAGLDVTARTQLVRLSLALSPFWLLRGYLVEGIQWLENSLRAIKDCPNWVSLQLKASVLNSLGRLLLARGSDRLAHELFEESLSLWQSLGEQAEVGNTLGYLGAVALYRADYATATAYNRQSLALRRQLTDHTGVAEALYFWGRLESAQGRYRQAQEVSQETLSLRQQLSDPWQLADSLVHLGMVKLLRGEVNQAAILLEKSLVLRRELGDKRGIANSLDCQAEVASFQGDYTTATVFSQESLRLRQEWNDLWNRASNQATLGLYAIYRGDWEQARNWLAQSQALREQAADSWGLAACDYLFGLLALYRQEEELAGQHFKQSLRGFEELKDGWGMANSRYYLGLIALRQGYQTTALALFRQSLAWSNEADHFQLLVKTLLGLSLSAQQFGWLARATRIAEWVGSLVEASYFQLPPLEQSLLNQVLTHTRNELTPARFELARQQGRAFSRQHLIEYADGSTAASLADDDNDFILPANTEVAPMVGSGSVYRAEDDQNFDQVA